MILLQLKDVWQRTALPTLAECLLGRFEMPFPRNHIHHTDTDIPSVCFDGLVSVLLFLARYQVFSTIFTAAGLSANRTAMPPHHFATKHGRYGRHRL